MSRPVKMKLKGTNIPVNVKGDKYPVNVVPLIRGRYPASVSARPWRMNKPAEAGGGRQVQDQIYEPGWPGREAELAEAQLRYQRSLQAYRVSLAAVAFSLFSSAFALYADGWFEWLL